MAQLDKDKLITRYLLKESSEQEQTELEERYFSDDQYFEEFLAVEDELIDAYVRGEMPARARERFESQYLTTPQRCQRVKFARNLVNAVGGAPITPPLKIVRREGASSRWQSWLAALRPQNFGTQAALAAAALVIVLGGLWLLVENLRQHNAQEQIAADRTTPEKPSQPNIGRQPERVDRPSENPRNDQTKREPEQQPGQANGPSNRIPRSEKTVKQQPPRPSIASFVLTPGLVRDTGGASNRLLIPPGKDLVALRLPLEEDNYRSYSAALETVAGQRIWSDSKLKARSIKSGKALTLRLPTKLLSNRDYILTLRGTSAGGNDEDIGEYSFRIVRR